MVPSPGAHIFDGEDELSSASSLHQSPLPLSSSRFSSSFTTWFTPLSLSHLLLSSSIFSLSLLHLPCSFHPPLPCLLHLLLLPHILLFYPLSAEMHWDTSRLVCFSLWWAEETDLSPAPLCQGGTNNLQNCPLQELPLTLDLHMMGLQSCPVLNSLNQWSLQS